MIVHLDTSILIEALDIEPDLFRRPSERGDKLVISTLVLYEWLRRPRSAEQIELLEAVFPPERMVAFDEKVAHLAAQIYRQVKRARAREVDIAIAACAIEHGAAMWTLNRKDFEDIPDLSLYAAP